MRKRILFLAVAVSVLSSCAGQTEKSPAVVNLSGLNVVWEGNVTADPKLRADFDATVDCVRQLSTAGGGTDAVKTTSYPNVVVIQETTFPCYGIADERACVDFPNATIYISQQDLYTYVFTHEAVHWIAQVDNSQHYRSYFSCTYQVDAFYQ